MAQHWVATDFGGLEVLEFQETEVRAPGIGEVTIDVRASGMNPADFKHISRGSDRSQLPIPLGYEASGVISAVGPETGFEVDVPEPASVALLGCGALLLGGRRRRHQA